MLPAAVVGKTAEHAELAAWLQALHTQSLWDNHALDGVERGWDAFEHLQIDYNCHSLSMQCCTLRR